MENHVIHYSSDRECVTPISLGGMPSVKHAYGATWMVGTLFKNNMPQKL